MKGAWKEDCIKQLDFISVKLNENCVKVTFHLQRQMISCVKRDNQTVTSLMKLKLKELPKNYFEK